MQRRILVSPPGDKSDVKRRIARMISRVKDGESIEEAYNFIKVLSNRGGMCISGTALIVETLKADAKSEERKLSKYQRTMLTSIVKKA